MNFLKLIILTLFLIACSHKETGTAYYPITLLGTATNGFYQGQPLVLAGVRAVDSSVLTVNNVLKVFVDWGDGQFLGSTELLSGTEKILKRQTTKLNFTYILHYNGQYYLFGQYQHNIYLQISSDGEHWQYLNNGLPVITRSTNTNSDWHQLWNVAVDVDKHGTWHLLAECSDNAPNQLHVGLCYATGIFNGNTINFDQHKRPFQVIKNAGNPYLKIVKGGMLVIHGQIYRSYGPFDNQHWFVTASTKQWKQNNFTTHQNRFSAGTPGVHDCDPHVTELPKGGLLLLLSVDQSHITTLWHSSQSLQGLFNELVK